MFVRVKPSGPYRYLQIVANHRQGRRTVQRVLTSLGRVDQLAAAGAVDVLLRSLGRFGAQVQVIEAHRHGQLEAGIIRPLGPDLVFGRLWQTVGLQAVLIDLLQESPFEFPMERAVYLTVLHRLWEFGSPQAAARWRGEVHIPRADDLQPQHLDQAIQWLGETKGVLEQAWFLSRRHLFADYALAFFNTTSLDFEGRDAGRLGQYGHSKGYRPKLRQMVVGAMLTGDGRPVCCELWPGDYARDRGLLPVLDRLRERFGVRQVCWVADRGMTSARTVQELEHKQLQYILGARLRRQREVRREGLGWADRGREVSDNVWVKEVWLEGQRYIVCYYPEEAAKDAAEREAILRALQHRLQQGTKFLGGNRGFQRFLRSRKGTLTIDPAKVVAEGRYDGRFVLRTNTTLPAVEVAAQFQRLLLVEQFFRAAKSLLEHRPISHQWDATIAGHVFCSFLALVLLDELHRHLAARGWQFEWADIRRDLEALVEVEVRDGQQWYGLRTALQGVAAKVLQAVGVAVPPPMRPFKDVVPSPEAIGNLPVIFHAQIFGAQEQGWLDELGVTSIKFLRFPSGTPFLQAIATGQVDIAYVGVGPLLIAGHRGLPVKAVAATSKDTMAYVTTEMFAAIYAAHRPPAAAFAAFAQQQGRKLRIGTVPRGTTPDVFLRMWLTSIGVDPEQDVDIVPMGGDQLVAAIVAGQVDAVVSGEPQITLIQRANPRFKVLLYAKDLVPSLPGGVVVVQQRLIDRYPALVEKLVELHLRANKLFNADKDFFARTVSKALGEHILPLEVAKEAVRSPATHMVTNHRALAAMLAVYDEFEVREGVWPKALSIDDIFEYRFYDAVVQKHPELADEEGR
jgi:ABC-type nitrate/sulfonate/bicarbonate transport system substrate-binding protein